MALALTQPDLYRQYAVDAIRAWVEPLADALCGRFAVRAARARATQRTDDAAMGLIGAATTMD